jgi:hypothetical protein
MEETWKDIEGFEGLYQVSNLGRVRSLDHMSVRNLNGKIYDCMVRGKVLSPSKDSSGYLHVRLWRNGNKTTLVHRLVAKAFIPNPDNLETVNHKDENITNNRADNLEYMSVTDNIRYGTGISRRRLTQRKPVEQLTMDGKHIAYFDGIIDASIATGAPRELIGKVCHGRKKSAGGYRWKFKE